MVALLTSVRNSPCFGGLRRTKTCHRQLFARPSVFLRYFLHAAKSTNPFPFREVRGFPNLDSAHPNNNFPLTKLNPLPLRGSVPAGTARSACFFRRPWWHFSAAPPLFPTFCIVQKVDQKNYSALRRYPCRDGTLRVLFGYFLHIAKSICRKSLKTDKYLKKSLGYFEKV